MERTPQYISLEGLRQSLVAERCIFLFPICQSPADEIHVDEWLSAANLLWLSMPLDDDDAALGSLFGHGLAEVALI